MHKVRQRVFTVPLSRRTPNNKKQSEFNLYRHFYNWHKNVS